VFITTMAITPERAKFGPLLFAGDWQRGLETAARLGYDAVEVSLRDPQSEAVKALGKAIQSSGLALSAVATGQSYYNDGLSPTSSDLHIRRKLLDRMKGHIGFAARWGAFVIIGGVRGRLEGAAATFSEQRERALEEFCRYAEYARERNVGLVIEPINRYETNYINTVQEALEVIRSIGAGNLSVLGDTFHMNIEEVSISGALEEAGDSLGYVHLADSNRWAPGQGHIDFAEVANTLHSLGYGGYIGAEVLPLPDSDAAARWAIEFFRNLPRG
jgi:sugar phosphate isomerase/epimerase